MLTVLKRSDWVLSPAWDIFSKLPALPRLEEHHRMGDGENVRAGRWRAVKCCLLDTTRLSHSRTTVTVATHTGRFKIKPSNMVEG